MKTYKLPLVLAAAFLAGASLAVPAHASIFPVPIQNFEYVPETLTICVGDTVRWTNLDGMGHTVLSNAVAIEILP